MNTNNKQTYYKFLEAIDHHMKIRSIDNELLVTSEHTQAKIIKASSCRYIIFLNDCEHCYDETTVFLYNTALIFEKHKRIHRITTNASYHIDFEANDTFEDILQSLTNGRDAYGMFIMRGLIEISKDITTAYEMDLEESEN